MKHAALFAIVSLSLVVGAADADNGAMGLDIPEHWRKLPEMVRKEPAARSVSIVTRGAWGDPVGGVFFCAQTIETTRKGKLELLRVAMLETLGAGKLEFEPPDPAADPMTVEFSAAGFTGTLIADISSQPKGKLRVRSVACFYNQREPEISEQLCQVLLTRFAASL